MEIYRLDNNICCILRWCGDGDVATVVVVCLFFFFLYIFPSIFLFLYTALIFNILVVAVADVV